MKVFIIGTGLIGGSFALDIQQEYPEAVIYGIDTNKKHITEALECRVIHEEASFEDLQNAAIVFLTIPVDVALSVLPKVLDIIQDNTLVIDVGSTKQRICEAVKNHPKRRNFLAAHPIAGTEFSGPKAALRGLYKQKTNIICEVEKTAFKLQEKALEIFSKIGMRIRYMDAVSHDKHIAYVSHLSHISSFMLGKTVIDKEKNERDIFDMAGSGFESTVRLAKSSPAMWTPIFEQNKDNIVETLDEYIGNLKQFKKLMEEHKFDQVFDEMQETNHIATILKGIK
ncbi:prephenate dehydrogenase [Flavobacteriaceae bacterium]|jgi:prephenate dehydrogenase|nr:prephenate dehydrogenase [Flavobacteriaceae bacterium]MDB4560390.1 prephenate dehydrogenase [Flavobacteriaceae bacterium]MDC0652437.1 prephenate dehydrogenase [Flavobacteriaceae bacterium]MDC1168076.1 prephenate dehydrogenase [Flavobacteriaceae bacterium]MDC3285681.1 prephenate dehydrogenase [Flavobacteriaceae bacterium]